ncbi:MAG: DUF1638 domain-containing protein [Candidatus Methanoplasma sp.]|jgi:hypothetical protein|nr:DUF1638 domain-containing protein [Candidatus Methanoplasma sp.]
MRLGIVACDILKNEIEFVTGKDPDFVHREYLEFALHIIPENMRAVIIEKVNALEGKVDAVLLGYATCMSLGGITDKLDVPAAMLEGSDCIEALLGTERYEEEKRSCTGTWFSSPGWAKEGVNGLIREFHLDSVEGYDPSYFLDMLFGSYERCLFIDPGIGSEKEFHAKSEDFAKTLKLRHERCICGLERIEEAVARAKKLGAGSSN